MGDLYYNMEMEVILQKAFFKKGIILESPEACFLSGSCVSETLLELSRRAAVRLFSRLCNGP